MPGISSRVKRHIRNQLAADSPHCRYCGKFLPNEDERTLDHVTALGRGGTDDPSNAALACEPCNRFKRDMSVDEFRLLLSWMLERLSALPAG
jgi:5-methylcytosine-specific restriction endonuclease McrA